jgi:type I restriction enzyme S subunit
MIEAESHEGYKLCASGDLVVNTMWAWMGALGIAREDGMVSPSYNVYRVVSERLTPRYYDYLCRVPAHVTEITRHSKGIWKSRLRLYPESFYALNTPLPPSTEQHAIADFLDCETSKIDARVGRVRDAVDRLEEYRAALISAVVTGKIDVRRDLPEDVRTRATILDEGTEPP